MISVKEAVQTAVSYAIELFGGEATLEEVEPSNDGKHWLITLSFNELTKTISILGNTKIERRYKIFKIDAESNEVVSVKIRQL